MGVDHENRTLVVAGGSRRMSVRFPEAAGERHLGRGAERGRLIPEDDHAELEERGTDRVEGRLVDLTGEVDAADLRTEDR